MACLVPVSAQAANAHLFESSFGPDCTEGTEFVAPGPVAIDEENNQIYVADLETGTLTRCNEDGTTADFSAGPGAGTNKITGFGFASGEALDQLAVDNGETSPSQHNVYVDDYSNQAIKAFDSSGEAADFSAGPGAGTNEITGFGFLCGVAVDSNGAIYAADGGPGVVTIYAPSGEEITSFSDPEACNLAVDSNGAAYVSSYVFGGLPVQKFIPSQYPVTPATTYTALGPVAPDRVFGVAVDPSNNDLYVDEHNAIAQYDEEGTHLLGTFAESGPGALSASEGVAADGDTEKVYASDTAGAHRVNVYVPPPPEPPRVLGAASATKVTTTEADLLALINPEFFATHYHFEYLTEAAFQANGKTFDGAQSSAESDLGSAGEPQGAHAHIGGLAPDTTYRFQVVAENENGSAASAEAASFTTFASFPAGLPDGRAYEMVSPAQKIGEVFPPEPTGELGGSCGDCLPGITELLQPMQSAPDGEALLYMGQPFSGGLAAGPNEYVARRGSGGWGSQSLSPPTFTNDNAQSEGYKAVSTDLSKAVVFQVEPTLSPEAPSKGGRSYANLYLRSADGSLQPLVRKAPPQRDPGEVKGLGFRITFTGANAGSAGTGAFTHLSFEANDALSEEVEDIAPAAPLIEAEERNLYEWVGGQLRLINVLPGNTAAAGGSVIGSGRLLTDHEENGFEGPNVDHAISADGSRIFWSSEETGQVYVRIDGKETLEIPGPGNCKESTPRPERACFLTASSDGSRVLLSDGQVYELDEGAGAYEPSVDLSQGEGGFQGILGAGEDLGRIYFVDTAALTEADEENANEEHAEAGEFNLYAYGGGDTAFIAALQGDSETGDNVVGLAYGAWKASVPDRTAQVSADGRLLAFMSQAPLQPGFDNELRGGGLCRPSGVSVACREVYVYEAATTQLSCASCNPTGLRPLGGANLSLIKPFPSFPAFRQLGNLSPAGNGRLFFESRDALSPRDTNGNIQDVYEWEPNGVGSCQRAGGCIFLISTGHSANDSMFLDSTPSGNDAFLITREQLLPRDKDELLDVYDARAPHVAGEEVGFPEGEGSACGGEACKGPIAAAPSQSSAGSSQFAGPGNVKKKQKQKKHHKKKKQKKHHKRSAKHNRGGSK